MQLKNDPEIVRAIPKFSNLILKIGVIAGCVGLATYPLALLFDRFTGALAKLGYCATVIAVAIVFGEGIWYFACYWTKKFQEYR